MPIRLPSHPLWRKPLLLPTVVGSKQVGDAVVPRMGCLKVNMAPRARMEWIIRNNTLSVPLRQRREEMLQIILANERICYRKVNTPLRRQPYSALIVVWNKGNYHIAQWLLLFLLGGVAVGARAEAEVEAEAEAKIRLVLHRGIVDNKRMALRVVVRNQAAIQKT